MSYVKDCIFCGQKIRMDNPAGKWTPYEVNTNEVHECKSKQPQQAQAQAPQQKQVQDSKLTLEQRVSRIEQKLGLL